MAQIAQNAFRTALMQIGFDAPRAEAIIELSGCLNVAMLGLLSASQITKLCKRISTRTDNPLAITSVQEQMLLALRFWIVNRQRMQLPINAADIMPALIMMQAQLMNQELEEAEKADKEITAKMPDKFKTATNWKIFSEALETYLGQLKGQGNVPLKYIIRKQEVPLPGILYANEQEQRVAITPLNGPAFERDNAKVYGIIKQLVLEGPGRSYILQFDNTSDGRRAWISLLDHFESDSFRNRNKEEAYAMLDTIHYEGEKKGFTFEKFVERHNYAFLELERHGEPILETKKVRDFLARINAPELQAAKQQVRANEAMMNDFQLASNFISLSVTPVKPTQRSLIGATQNITQGRGFFGRNSNRGRTARGRGRGTLRDVQSTGRGRGRGRGRGGRTVNTGYYTPEQWQNLSYEERNNILEARGTKRNVSSITSVTAEEEKTNNISAITMETGTIDADALQRQQQEIITKKLAGGNAGHQFGGQFGGQTNKRNFIGMMRSQYRRKEEAAITAIIARTQARQHKEQEPGQLLELDTHADTSCVGANCHIISYTEHVCEVSPFHPKYKPIMNVPIVQAGAAYDDMQTGQTYILVINQALYLGDDLPGTLVNPNQMRMNGLIVDDTPKHLSPNPETAHSIFIPEHNLRIPLVMQGVISGIPVRKPSVHELENCTWIQLTSDELWDPQTQVLAQQEQLYESGLWRQDKPQRLINTIINKEPQYPIDLITNLSPEILTSRVNASVNVTLQHTHSSIRHHRVPAIELAKIWNVGITTAERTLQATTQLAIRNAIHPIQRRFRTEVAQLRYPRLSGRHGKFYTDTFFAQVPSLSGCSMGQMYTNDVDFTRFIPMKQKSEAANTLLELCQDIGIPAELHSDDAKELTCGEMGKIARKFHIRTTQAEPYSPWQVRAEISIREIKRTVRSLMAKKKAHPRLWDYCTTYACELRSLTAHDHFTLHGRTPHELVTGYTPDISEYLDYAWYDDVWYYDAMENFPNERRKLAKWLGVAHRVGQALCYYILPSSGIPIVRSTIQNLTEEELKDKEVQASITALNMAIENNIAHKDISPDAKRILQDEETEIYEPMEPEAEKPEIADYTGETYDALISAQVLFSKGDILQPATVTSRKHDSDGNPIGIYDPNPILDSRVYEVTFSDGHVEEYAANTIAENIYSQVDEEGHQFIMLKEIIDHRKDNTAVHIDDKWIQHGNNKTLRKTTQGWQLRVLWRDGTTSWEHLRNLKESNPIQVAEYAIANKLTEEAAFAWWVPTVLRRRERIIKSIKARHHIKSHKFGIEIPHTVERALEIDRETGTDYWFKALEKEMKHVRPAFNVLEPGTPPPIGSQWIPCHMVFDVKMDFTRKARFVAGGNVAQPPSCLTYSSVVARDSVRLAFLIAALNDLNILAADVGNAYLNAPTKEKVHTTCGIEFGQGLVGRTAVICRALYGLKSSGAAWRSMLAGTLHDLGYKSSLADPDVWFRSATKLSGCKYYEYVFVYVDDLLVISEKPEETMNTLAQFYRLKEGSVGRPTQYLGAQIKEYRFTHDPLQTSWSISADKYLKEALQNIENELHKMGKQLPTKVNTPLSSNYRPELDVSSLLPDHLANYYQQILGILRWLVELGRIDIHLPVALLAQYLTQPRYGHLDQAFHIFAYLKRHNRSRIVLDPTRPQVDESQFIQADWQEFYPDAVESIPPNAPEPLGNPILMSCFVDADHAGNKVTRRSHTGIIIFCNRAPILWYSKRQNTVETSTFGSEFIATRIAVELIEGLRYKLRMFGIPIDGPTNVYCDNNSVVINSTKPESTLKKKHNAIAYHRVREAIAAKTIRVAKEDSSTNIADMLTKPVSAIRLKELCSFCLY